MKRIWQCVYGGIDCRDWLAQFHYRRRSIAQPSRRNHSLVEICHFFPGRKTVGYRALRGSSLYANAYIDPGTTGLLAQALYVLFYGALDVCLFSLRYIKDGFARASQFIAKSFGLRSWSSMIAEGGVNSEFSAPISSSHR